ncbi:MAG: hypothetical protein HYV60_09040 [Planctomycetia bacterium]|nr:hypothetical protein [Planctomycetia bacterium]
MSSESALGGSARAAWEYRQIMATPVEKLMQSLQEEARDGWELVCVTVEEPYYRAFLKRPVPTRGS